jgi:hypothetical protein
MGRKKAKEDPDDAGASSGWNSPRCTRPRCRTTLDFGAGLQFVDEEGNQQRYCWPDWVKYNADPKRFPGVIETKSPEGA